MVNENDAGYFRAKYEGGLDLKGVPWITGAVDEDLLRQVREGVFEPGETVLELGCGIGVESNYLDRQGMEVTAIDRNEDAIERARALRSFYDGDARFEQADAFDVEFDQRFDIVMDRFLFHNLPPDRRDAYVRKLASFTRPGGLCYVRGFSDAMPPSRQGDGPYRLSSADLLDQFLSLFSLEHLYRYEGLPLPHDEKPQRYWSLLIERSNN